MSFMNHWFESIDLNRQPRQIIVIIESKSLHIAHNPINNNNTMWYAVHPTETGTFKDTKYVIIMCSLRTFNFILPHFLFTAPWKK